MKKVFIDCGGYRATSVEFFKKLYPKSQDYKIYSFEANPNFNKYFEKHKDVEYRNVAIWDKDGEIVFHYRDSGSSSVIKGKAKVSRLVDRRVIESINFSKWVKENLNKNDYNILKIDVEGAEYAVFEKMIKDGTIDYFNKFYVEWHWFKTNGDIKPERHLDIIETLNNKGIITFAWDTIECKTKTRDSLAIGGKDTRLLPEKMKSRGEMLLQQAKNMLNNATFSSIGIVE